VAWDLMPGSQYLSLAERTLGFRRAPTVEALDVGTSLSPFVGVKALLVEDVALLSAPYTLSSWGEIRQTVNVFFARQRSGRSNKAGAQRRM